MADWHVVESVGRTLTMLVQRRITQLGIPNVDVGLVTTASFTTLATTAQPFISIFLYQIAGNAELRNRVESMRPDGSRRRQALPLELSYMITPWGVRNPDDVASDGVATQEEARLLGVVMQAFYDNAEVGRGDLFETSAIPVWAPHDGLQVNLESLPVDVHYRIWDAAELGYRLSLMYRVRVVGLDPLDLPPGPPVTEAMLEHA